MYTNIIKKKLTRGLSKPAKLKNSRYFLNTPLIPERLWFHSRRCRVTNTCVKMNALTTEEKVYLIECFYSTGKVYANAYRGFRTKFEQHKVASENTLKRYEKNSYSCSCFVS